MEWNGTSSKKRTHPKRMIYLSDPSGFEITLVLWGERAAAFDGEAVLRDAEGRPVIALFVGTLVKPFEGRKSLSGGAPCRWYIDEELPEINELREQLNGKIPVVQGISLPGQTPAEISAQVDLETKTVRELRDLNIWVHKKTKFFCTVVITKLAPGERWWFHARNACNRGTIPYGASYKCPDKDCKGVGGMPRYRLCYSVSDGTGEIEFMLFDKTGRDLVGKAALTVIRSRAPSAMTIDEAIEYARTDESIPKEILSAVSRKYRMVVSVTTKSFEPEVDVSAYQVHRIEMVHGKQHGKQNKSALLGRNTGLTLTSPGTSSGGTGLNSDGETLAKELLFQEGSSLEASTPVPSAPLTSAATDSLAGSETVPPQTPQSVSKPGKDSDGEDHTGSAVKMALFQDAAAAEGSKGVQEVAPRADPGEVGLPIAEVAESLSPSSVEAPKDKKRRQQKTQSDTALKKQKP